MNPTANGTLTQGESVTFDGRTRNTGALGVTADFYDNFTYRWGTSGGWTQISEHSNTDNKAPNATWSNISGSFPLANAGTLQIQHCSDSRGTFAETN